MGKKIKSTVKFRFKKKQKKKERYNLVGAKIIIFNYNSARQKSITVFSLENGVKKLSLSTPFGEK